MIKKFRVLFLSLIVLIFVAACDDQAVDNTENEDAGGGNLGSITEDIGTFDVNEGIGGFATGGYDENAIHPTQVGWTRQSRFKGVDEPEIKQTIELPGRVAPFASDKTEPIVDADGNFYLKINEQDEAGFTSIEGDIDGFYAFNREGEILWERTNYHPEYDILPGNSANFSPSLDSNNQLIGTLDWKTIGGLDKDTGEMNFVYQFDGNLAIDPWSQAIDSDGVTYFVYDGQMVAINPDGSIKWEHVYNDDGDEGFTPVISEDRLFLKNRTGIMAFDLDGNHLWEEELDYVGGHDQSNILITEDGNLYFVHDERLMSYSSDGELLWDVEVDDDTSYMSGYNGLALSEDGLIIGLFLPNLYAFDLDGNEVWQTDGPRTFGAVTIDSEGTSYFAGQSNLYSVDRSGNLNWSFELPTGDPGNVVIGPNQEIYLTIDSSDGSTLIIIGDK